jgi:DNA modification methylase
MYRIEEIKNKILEGHVLEVLPKIPERSIDLIITSPPYYYQRDYETTLIWWDEDKYCEHQPDWYKQKKNTWGKPNIGSNGKLRTKNVDNFQVIPEKKFAFCLKCGGWFGQLGLEPIPEMYLDHLFQIFGECRRILKKKGSFWLNIGDKYMDNVLSSNFTEFEGIMKKVGHKKERKYFYPELEEKSLIGIPDLIKTGLIDIKWLCRNEIIWKKPDAMPSSVKDRFTEDYEKFFFFTKSNKYYFEQQLEEAKELRRWGKKQKKSKYNIIEKATYYYGKKNKYGDIEKEAENRQGLHKKRGIQEITFRPNLPDKDEFIKKMRERFTIDDIVENTDIKRSTVEHWFRKDEWFSFPSKEDWNKVVSNLAFFPQTLVGIKGNLFPELLVENTKLDKVDYSGEIRDDKGELVRLRNKRSVWSIRTAAYSGSHFAVFPEELIKTPIQACCPPDGVVLDCFFGRGTTGKVANDLGRYYVGIDLNPNYIHQAKRFIKQKKRLTEFYE